MGASAGMSELSTSLERAQPLALETSEFRAAEPVIRIEVPEWFFEAFFSGKTTAAIQF